MPKSAQVKLRVNPSPTEPKKGAAAKIHEGKVELSDAELTRVSGGQKSHKQFTNIDP